MQINGEEVGRGRNTYSCCICGHSIWLGGIDKAVKFDKWDVDIGKNKWLVTCGDTQCQEMLALNPLAYEAQYYSNG